MSKLVIVVEKASDWGSYYPSDNVVAAQDYLKEAIGTEDERVQVINLCRSQVPVSAITFRCRPARVTRSPSVRTINDLRKRALYGLT
jgi:hypothetical protein